MGVNEPLFRTDCQLCKATGTYRSLMCPLCRGIGYTGTEDVSPISDAILAEEGVAAGFMERGEWELRLPVGFSFRVAVAVAANSRQYGIIGLSGNRYGIYVPAGCEFLVYYASGVISLNGSGASSYDLALITVEDGGAGASEKELGAVTGIPGNTLGPSGAAYWRGAFFAPDRETPLATIGAGVHVGCGFRNKSSSTASTGANSHICHVAGEMRYIP